ncbi:hypothetical protein BH23ACT5_BH23ACT5_17600 [soil metagenome]
MWGIRTVALILMAAVATGVAAPAAAQLPAPDGLTLWAVSVEVTGLDATDTATIRVLWTEFASGIPAHSACLLASPPRIVAKTDMAPRAAYAPKSATLLVKPGDVSRLVVFHELAHHLDFTCGAADSIGDDVRRVQGIDSSKAWWLEGDPVTWPAEYFANAVAIALGEQSNHDVHPDTVEVVARWLGYTEPEPIVTPVILDNPNSQVPALI